jgi:hypothetical protein
MFFRLKASGPRSYLQIVESRRDGARVQQHVIATIGRADELAANGGLASLLASGARFCEQVLLLSTLDDEHRAPQLGLRRIGAPMAFGRLWDELGCRAVLDALLGGRGFGFAVERAVFATVLHRLMVSGSDRACEKWMADYDIPGTDDLNLHHFYRAMAWLGEELDAEDGGQKHATPFAPRCVKDQIEEALFERRRDLFSELSIVFMDTTSLSFTGEGGETLGERGYSKDHRPDLMQMILCLVMDAEGRPVCTEMWPGNTADVSVLLPVVDRLRGRFGIGRVCVVADRGMISEATIAGLERDVVLADERAFTPLLVTRAAGQETQLFAKEVPVAGRRYIVCRNEAEAEKDRADRQAIVAALEQQLQRGDKSLIGNSAYRRYLRRIRVRQADGAAITPPAPAFEIDAGRLADEAKFDGIFVLRTNSRISPLLAMLRYRDLLRVEQMFRAAKSTLHTRPIFHSSDAAIRGHVFCSFLALVLQKELADRGTKIGLQLEWDDVRRDLDRLQHATIKQEGKSWELRTEATGAAAGVFKALRLALPPRVRPLGQSPPTQPAAAPKRRGRPRRSATRS